MDDLNKFLNETPKNQWNRLVRKNANWMMFLKETYKNINSLNEKLYLFANNLTDPPKCAVIHCNNSVKWTNNTHYTVTCSYSCSQQLRKQNGTLSAIQNKARETLFKNYGVEHAMQSPAMQEKRLSTMISRYNAKVSPKSREATNKRVTEWINKSRETVKERYGVENIQQVPHIREKTKSTFMSRYGVDNVSAIPEVKLKKSSERQERWQESYSNITIIGETIPFDLREQHPHANLRIKFTCNICGKEEELPSETVKYRHRTFGNACSNCCQIDPIVSRDESLIADYISSLGIDVIRNDRKIIQPKEIDIWLPQYQIAIEYCGLYWHSERNGKEKTYHKDKHDLCTKNNIRLITIFEDEWYHRKDIVLSRLNNLLDKDNKKIMAESCTLKVIDSKTAKIFNERNHLQGSGKYNYAYGLYYNDSLVSVMSFTKLKIDKWVQHTSGVWELSRFCSELNINIVGGASRLFNQFVTDLNPEKIISYSDNRWNTGNLYSYLGFINDGQTPLNYWYIDFPNVKRLHRYGLRKQSTDEQNLTEWQNRKNQGWDRIWDCGNIRWIWSKK